jgi:predicted alpha-1,2-mannosidase
MIGQNADNVLAEAYLKGLADFDYEKAYAASRWLALNPTPEDSPFRGRAGIIDYINLGYVPADGHGSSASWTIEMSYNDWCLAHWARALGKDDDVKMFMDRSRNWQNLWDPATGYLRGRNRDGSFANPFRPSIWTDYYVEGNARQWLWAPLHDAAGLIELMGGKEEFTARLEDFFEQSVTRPDTILWDTFYWHGNEPDIHAAYLFLFAGRPDLTQKWVRWAMDQKYKNAPNGLDGNDDCGTLSSWYVWSALGFYPLAGSDLYLIGSPLFDKVTLRLLGGILTVRAEGEPGRNIYVKSVTLNGEPLIEPWFLHKQIVNGGELVFEMSGEPSGWGR